MIVPFYYRKPKKLTKHSNLNNINSICIHNTGATNSIETDTSYHIDDRKWVWLGYGYYIDFDGTTYEVRGYEHINAGVEFHNHHIVSIALRGNFNKKHPTKEQIESLNKLIIHLKKEVPTIKYVNGHKFWDKKTDCPGTNFPLGVFVESGDKMFNDTKGHFAEKEIEEAQKLGLVFGYEDNNFRPDREITRAEATAMILNLYKLLKK